MTQIKRIVTVNEDCYCNVTKHQKDCIDSTDTKYDQIKYRSLGLWLWLGLCLAI